MERNIRLEPGTNIYSEAYDGANQGTDTVAGFAADAGGGMNASSVAQEPAGADSCIICGARQAEGIRICMQFICETCEREMVHTDVDDARYGYFIERMRKIVDRICDV